MKKYIRCFRIVIAVVLTTAAGGERSASHRAAMNPIQYVIVVSVDGMRPDSYMSSDALQFNVPTLTKLMNEGAYSPGVEPVFPSVTYPSHVTLSTGVTPARHGILTNLQWDPLERNEQGWRWYSEDIQVPTLWDRAKARGLRTSLLGWPVTVGAAADLRIPDFWRTYQPEDEKLIAALSTDGAFDKVRDRFPNLAASYMSIAERDDVLTEIACRDIIDNHPNLLLLHLVSVDFQQHFHGPLTAKAKGAIEKSDHEISKLLEAVKTAGISNHTIFVVLSDHGFAAVSQSVRLGVLFEQQGLITLKDGRVQDWKAESLEADGSAYIYLNDPKDTTTQAKLLSVLQPLAGKPGSGIRRVLGRDDIARLGGDPQAALALEAEDGFAFVHGYDGTVISPSEMRGTHGYLPDREDMQASFIAVGPGIAHGAIPHVRLIDIAPTIAGWLGVDLGNVDGVSLRIERTPEHRGQTAQLHQGAAPVQGVAGSTED